METTTLLTGEDLARLAPTGPCELVRGELVAVSPTNRLHSKIEFRVANLIDDFVSKHDLGDVHVGEPGIYTQRDPDTVRGADVLFISHERTDQLLSSVFFDIPPELVVEVISPSNSWTEMHQKIAECLGIGVDAVWLIEPTKQEAWIYTPDAPVEHVSGDGILHGRGILEGFALPLPVLFER